MSYTSVLAGIAGFTVRVRYKLDETSGTAMVDSGPAATNGTYTSSPTLAVAGIVTDGGTSVSTTAAGGYLAGPATSGMGLSGSGTILFWYIHGGATNPAVFANTGSSAGTRSDLDLTGASNVNLALRILGTTSTFSGAGSSITDGLPHLIGLVYTSGVGWEVFVDGTSKGTNATNSTIASAFAAMRWGRAQAGTTYNQTHDDIVVGNGAVSAADQAALYAAGLATSGATGTLATTLAGATLAAVGTETFTGTLASTLAGATLVASGTGAAGTTGTLAATLAGATLAASGKETITGALSSALAGATLAASGAETITGTLTTTLAGATLTGAGGETFTGTLTATLAGAALSASGVETVSGTLAVTLEGVSLAAGGTEDITGSLAVTLDGATLTGTGTTLVAVTGTLESTLAGATLDADGNSHAPFRDVKVYTIVDQSRVITITDQSRIVTPVDHPRELVITDRSL